MSCGHKCKFSKTNSVHVIFQERELVLHWEMIENHNQSCQAKYYNFQINQAYRPGKSWVSFVTGTLVYNDGLVNLITKNITRSL